MKIKKIKFGNFRNFAEPGEIIFSTDGKVTVIYGTNGDGKTTLHQLFQWILYGRVNFNRTTSADKLYNLQKGRALTPDRSFMVWGQIEFEHNGNDFLVRREWEYNKNRNGDITHRTSGDSFFVQRQNSNGDWKTLDRPNGIIEEVLPSGLAPYFFFDGETMIADLKIRGTDSAKTLKKALHSIFELEIYEKAIVDIGNKGKSQSAIGQLEQKKSEAMMKVTTEETQKGFLRDISVLKNRLEKIENENKEANDRLAEIEKREEEISEQIGSNKSKRALEKSRAALVQSIDRDDSYIKKEMLSFGKEIADNYSYLLLTDVVKNAGDRLYLHVQDEEKKIIPGLTKELIKSLLKNEHKNCICGHDIGEKELESFEDWKKFFPPASYKSTYDAFQRNAIRYSGKYDEQRLASHFISVLKAKDDIRSTENEIEEIDEELKQTGNVDDLIFERKNLENERNSLKSKLESNAKNRGEWEHQIRVREKKLSSMENASDEVKKYNEYIALMEAVSNALKGLQLNETRDYSFMLKKEIQGLIDIMLTSKREVYLNDDFQLQVKDSFGDESKSEGQFAVISFAYIGGILKVLKSHERLAGKEYPLILDGPFSKLDEIQKMNVATVIPKYAPQVVIFSKDPLEDFIAREMMGKTWTIQSNEEKNYAVVKEGALWN